MTSHEIQNLLERQRRFYRSGVTIPVSFRIEQLKKLYSVVKKYEMEINDALKQDLGKSHYEGFMCESGLVLSEISYMIRHTRKFAKRKRYILRLHSLLRTVSNSRFLMEIHSL